MDVDAAVAVTVAVRDQELNVHAVNHAIRGEIAVIVCVLDIVIQLSLSRGMESLSRLCLFHPRF